jgi:hypothetical protein
MWEADESPSVALVAVDRDARARVSRRSRRAGARRRLWHGRILHLPGPPELRRDRDHAQSASSGGGRVLPRAGTASAREQEFRCLDAELAEFPDSSFDAGQSPIATATCDMLSLRRTFLHQVRITSVARGILIAAQLFAHPAVPSHDTMQPLPLLPGNCRHNVTRDVWRVSGD